MKNPNLDKYAIDEISESSESDEEQKEYVSKFKRPGVKIPGNIGYDLKREWDTFSAGYKVNDIDWFGNPIHRKRPVINNPGPG